MRREQGAARLNREHPIRRGGRGVGDAGRVALREERADACALEDGGRLKVSSGCARERKAGGRSFAGHGARQDFPFFLVRNNRRFAGKDKFPFLAQTVLFLQARRGGEREEFWRCGGRSAGEPGRRAEEGDVRGRARRGINAEARAGDIGGADLGKKRADEAC